MRRRIRLTETAHILDEAMAGKRLSDAQAQALFECDTLPLLGMAAHECGLRKHPDPVVTYVLERNVNYSNVCSAGCDFCGFYASPNDREKAYVLSREALDRKLQELTDAGGRQILLQGGLHPKLGLEWYEEMLRNIKQRFNIHVHAFSPPELLWFGKLSRMPLREVVLRLREAGLDSVPGGGAEILSDRVRSAISKNKICADEWIGAMRTVSECGMRATATMMFGHIETAAERVEHLRRIRELQDETGVFTAFIGWTFQGSPKLRLQCPVSGGHDYLKTTAIARMYLDNIDNLQASWVTQGDKLGQVSLFFGCNDMGSTMMEENVVRAAGTSHHLNAEDIERLIRDAGFTPARRNFYYERLREET